MGAVLDAFWRAVAYCMHPRVMLWSLLPLLLSGGVVGVLGWLYWEPAVDGVRATLAQWELLAALMRWLDGVGGQALHALIAPMLIVTLAVPVIVVIALVAVALFMTPAIVALVEVRRFPDLERRRGAGWWQGLLWSLACTAAALAALLLSLPLWFVPPLALVLPPLVWGWLTFRVLAFDVLATHASAQERRALTHERRWPLLAVVSVWLYTLVFAFASCWFAHYLLAALHQQRLRSAVPPAPDAPPELPPEPPAALAGPAST